MCDLLTAFASAGGTHTDLTVKQKKQATAARVAYKPAPRWPAAAPASPGSVNGSDTSEGSGVRDGGPLNPAASAWVRRLSCALMQRLMWGLIVWSRLFKRAATTWS